MTRTLDGVTKRLHKRYKSWKDFEKKKNEDRQAFFDLVTELAAKQSLATKTIGVPEKYHTDPAKFIQQKFPEWEIISDINDGHTSAVVIQENPAYKEFTYVNPDLDLEFRRQVVPGEVYFDDEALQEENPELWESITEVKRVPKAESELTPEQVGKIQPYYYRGKPIVKFPAPRKPKDDS